MFKKSDVLPLTLAFISTVLIVGLGFIWLTKSNAIGSDAAKNVNQDDSLNPSNVNVNAPLSSESSSANLASSKRDFVTPYIVPQGTSVTINGSSKMVKVNQALRKRFHKKFPGTVVNINADGNEVGINLLASGEIDLAAMDRPLDEAEKGVGLAAIKINNSAAKDNPEQKLYYAYREPANSEVEAFLGYVLSPEAQLAITSNLGTTAN